MNWTEQQQRIFQWLANADPAQAKSLVARARAGTGKTTAILEGLKHAPEAKNGKVLVAAFNKRIVDHLLERVPKGVEVKTFHSLGLSLLKDSGFRPHISQYIGGEHALQACGVGAPSDVVEGVDALAELGKLTMSNSVERLEALARDHDCLPEDVHPEWPLARLLEVTLKCMGLALATTKDIDFNDMLWLPVLRNLSAKRGYDLILLDEGQDINAVQLSLSTQNLRPGGRICVVGDDRQGIYAFMGAATGSIDKMKTTLGADELPLTLSFRCPKAVIELAQRYVPDIQCAENAREGSRNAFTDKTLLASAVSPGDFVLSRTNAGAAEACMMLQKEGVKALCLGKDMQTAFRRLVSTFSSGARSVEAMMEKMKAWTERERLSAEKDEKRQEKALRALDNYEALLALSKGCQTPYELRNRLDRMFTEEQTSTAVICSTIHKVKGLETNNVFILVDSFRTDREASLEEENLKYVAITRAKEHVCLVGKPRGKNAAHPFVKILDLLERTPCP